VYIERARCLLSDGRAARRDKDHRRIAACNQQSVSLQAGILVGTKVCADVAGKGWTELVKPWPASEPRKRDVDQQFGLAMYRDFFPVLVVGDLSDQPMRPSYATEDLFDCVQRLGVEFVRMRSPGVGI